MNGEPWPFEGRDAEVHALLERLTSRAGTRAVLLRGPAGIGKTRLARALVE